MKTVFIAAAFLCALTSIASAIDPYVPVPGENSPYVPPYGYAQSYYPPFGLVPGYVPSLDSPFYDGRDGIWPFWPCGPGGCRGDITITPLNQ
jgi:hypothetical protein